ncbi:hypothetical protein AtEden1_Chr2g0231831 [Arabidopsis thaliana]
MNSNPVGEFREGEIDGKPFLIFTLLSSSGEAAIDSGGGDDLSLEPLFLCPTLRIKVLRLKPYTRDSDRSFFPMVVSPHFPTIQSVYPVTTTVYLLPPLFHPEHGLAESVIKWWTTAMVPTLATSVMTILVIQDACCGETYGMG